MDVPSTNNTTKFVQLVVSHVLPIFLTNCTTPDGVVDLKNLTNCQLRTNLLNNSDQLEIELKNATEQILYNIFSKNKMKQGENQSKNESDKTKTELNETSGEDAACDQLTQTMMVVHACVALAIWLCLSFSRRRKSVCLSRRACWGRPSIVVPVDLVEYEPSRLARYGYAACMLWTAVLMMGLFDGSFLISPAFLADEKFMADFGFVLTLMGIVNAIFISYLTAPLFATIYMRKLLVANVLGMAISGFWLAQSILETADCSSDVLHLLRSSNGTSDSSDGSFLVWLTDQLALILVTKLPVALSCLLLVVVHFSCLVVNISRSLADRRLKANVGLSSSSSSSVLLRMYQFVRPSRFESAVRYVKYLWLNKPALDVAGLRRKTNVAVDLNSVETELDSVGANDNNNNKKKKNLKSRVKSKVVGLVHYKSGFKFSTRIICTMVASFTVLYMISLMVLLSLRALFDKAVEVYKLEYVQNVVAEFNFAFPDNFTYEQRISLLKDCGYTIKYSFYASVCSDLVLHVVIMVLMILNYKRDIQAMYRGDLQLLAIQEHMTASPANSVLASLRYAGTQIMFILMSFLLNFFVLIILCIIISFVVILPLKHGISSWVVEKALQAVPPVIFSLILYFLQVILTKFVFLAESGRWLALNNVRFFHLFSYLAFFLNCLVGLFAALRRLLLALVIGLLNVGRLDRSTLPKTWEFLDTPYKMYIGCLRLEMVQNHPVLRCFVDLLLKTRDADNTASVLHRRVRNRWLVAYTLIMNPELSLFRKHNLTKRFKLTAQGMALVDVAQRKTDTPVKTDSNSESKSATEIFI